MHETILNILLIPLVVLVYGSGLLLWPIRGWVRRVQKVRGGFLRSAFIAQIVAYLIVACFMIFVRLGHFYYWFVFLFEINVVFTFIGIIAWIRDTRYEHAAPNGH
jgi:hypothetical protein